jgi:putative nucleotidyltransferase with HDIG domain
LDFAELQGRTIREDLARRDFTINSMAIRLSDLSSLPLAASKVVDPFGGQRDLKRRMLCALSRKVLRDDPLRLQRAFRFSAELGFAIEPLTLAWVRGEHRKLGEGRVACERVREELLRLLSQPTAAAALAAMDRSKLLTALLPEMESGRRAALRYYGKGGVVKHALQSVGSLEWILQRVDRTQTLAFIRHPLVSEKIQDYLRQTVAGFPRHALLKFAALLHDLGKPKTAQMIQGRLRFFGHEELGAGLAYKTARRLRFSNQECQALRLWVRNHMRLGNLAAAPKLTDKAIARYFRDLGEDGVGMILLSLADHYCYLNRNQWGKGKNPVEQTARELLERYYIQREKVLPAPLLNGHVLMRALRLKPGPRIGQLLEAIKDAQAEGRVRTREEAIAFAQLKIGNAKFKMR